ncbi:peptide-methionine (R)-S-oxide reductase MsrB [Echinicola sp. CAU 1574]|uniref:peptide-methionine (R)-S-oxide reductase n=2 Tax=Echinicola arenosa TaxID=2774144 RepID=A0ABR9AIX9_9BACT|nr:peptide-methionine (R)-S-oxide reductase MsrB [Echinicola arenosa]
MDHLYSLTLGEKLPEWHLESIFGDAVPSPKDYIGQPLVVLFFSLNCPGCKGRAIPFANRLVYELGEKINVLGVHSIFDGNEIPMCKLEEAREKFFVRFPYFKDQNLNTTFLDFKAGGTPHWILVDANGLVAYSMFGSDPNNALMRLDYKLDEILSGNVLIIDEPTSQSELTEPEGCDLRLVSRENENLGDKTQRFKNINSMLNWNNIIQFANHGNPIPSKRVDKSEAEWKATLSPEQFQITRLKGTERAHSSEMCSLFEPGKYACTCCDTLLFDAEEKFESGTGWPSFTQPVEENAVAYHKDASFGMVRVEITCNTCDAHLGHVFPDGPAPSGLRYCVNAVSLKKVG